ncbi:hypothetical protein CWE13_08045 [Aliidiomarina shirensis]|uniref:Ubiquinone biosynthesis accessory factor UbiJ n=1 Tax=Aliidiomarina shirensis TaxID=1048642 RepID=A0A432WSP3_9GAMM|nr:SCP2 sterol-binding domain-containing protein [Aliidiomarina shirensis]RUO36792.1 hypothetical protein CWE13_08045 [Aliidiomarina shirensis]
MSALQVFRAAVERSLNFALAADPASPQRMRPLAGKCFRLTVNGLPEPITLLFFEDRVSLMGPHYEIIDCAVTAALSDLPELSDAGKATQLLQSGRVQIVGDPVLAQQAAQVFKQLNIDWEEMLSGYIGDVPGYWASQLVAKLAAIKPEPAAIRQRASEFLTQEFNTAASPLQMAILTDDIKALEARLTRLEKRVSDSEALNNKN